MKYNKRQKYYNKIRSQYKSGYDWGSWLGGHIYGGVSGGNQYVSDFGSWLGGRAGKAFDEWRFRRRAYRNKWRIGYKKGRLGSRPWSVGSRPYNFRTGSARQVVGSRPS